MSVKAIVIDQYRELVNRASKAVQGVSVPQDGWIQTVRKALQMTAPQLAKRLGVTRAMIYKTEKAEVEGGITLKKMHEVANAMDCRFVYAIVPAHAEGTVEAYIKHKATKMAADILKRTNINMALESQDLTPEKIDRELERMVEEILKGRPSDLWNE